MGTEPRGAEAAGAEVLAIIGTIVVVTGVHEEPDDMTGDTTMGAFSSSSSGFSSSEISTLAEDIMLGVCTRIICASQEGPLLRELLCRTTRSRDGQYRDGLVSKLLNPENPGCELWLCGDRSKASPVDMVGQLSFATSLLCGISMDING
jgi:hypothetical protein